MAWRRASVSTVESSLSVASGSEEVEPDAPGGRYALTVAGMAPAASDASAVAPAAAGQLAS